MIKTSKDTSDIEVTNQHRLDINVLNSTCGPPTFKYIVTWHFKA